MAGKKTRKRGREGEPAGESHAEKEARERRNRRWVCVHVVMCVCMYVTRQLLQLEVEEMMK